MRHSQSASGTVDSTELDRLLEQFGQLESELQQIRSELTHSHRLATLGTLTSTIAHEYNNILTPVISYAQFALANPSDPELMQKAVQKALSGAQRAAKISSSVLGFAREQDETGPAALHEVVEEALSCLARPPAKDGIELNVDVPDVRITISALNLQQVLMNLILNARKAMHRDGGTLTLRGHVDGDYLKLDVADTGPGIPLEIQERLFEPFATTPTRHEPVERATNDQTSPADHAARCDSASHAAGNGHKNGNGHSHSHENAHAPHSDASRGDTSGSARVRQLEKPGTDGTGLGLCICRELLHQADGDITVSSTPGQGATFHLTMPLADDDEYLTT